MPESADSTRAYRPDIDGLRALAILLVIGYHYSRLPGGYVGVDVFFVISGYLITGLLLGDLEGSGLNLVNFYARRVRRILPALLIVILSCLFVGWVWLLPFDLRVLSKEAAASALYALNFLLWHEAGYFDIADNTKPLLHLWSLAVEEQFYLVWPALLLLAHKYKHRTTVGIFAILLASFVISLITVENNLAADFYSPLSRLWELAAGGLLVRFEPTRRRPRAQVVGSIFGVLLILGSAVLYDSGSRFPGYLAALPVLGAVLIVAAGPQSWFNRTVLACRPMVWLGKLSYSLYLWHWPVLVLATLLFADQHFRYLPVACLALSGLLAWGTYCWCERPIRRIPVNVGNAWRFLTVGIGSSVVIAAFALLLSSGKLVRTSDATLITQDYSRPNNGCTFAGLSAAEPDTAIFAPCEVIKFPGRPIVVLVGDSHAAALYGGLLAYLDAKRINLFEYSATGCMPLTVTGVTPACTQTYQYVLARIAHDKPHLVILSAYYLTWIYQLPTGYEKSVIPRMAAVRNAGAQNVLIVGQMPIWDRTLPRILNQEYLRRGQGAPKRMFTGLLPESLQVDDTLRSTSAQLGVPYYSLKEQLCNSHGCLTRVGDRLPEDLIVYDDGHLTTAGARYLMDNGLGQRIDSLLAGKR